MPSTYNPNLCSDESGRGFSEAEVRATAMTADLVGYDPAKAGGVFTFGGTGSLLYGVKIGLEKAVPDAIRSGLREPVVVLASRAEPLRRAQRGRLARHRPGERRHGADAPRQLDSTSTPCETPPAQALAGGRKIAAIVATMGSTDAFGIDDLEGDARAARRAGRRVQAADYRPHIHADAVIGWAWSVFNDYDFLANPLGFRGRTVRALAGGPSSASQHLQLADSIGIDFHKTGFAPYVSSLFLVRDSADFGLIARDRDTMPYLYQSGDYHPGMYTLETSRSGTGPMSALANLLLLGNEGYRTLLGPRRRDGRSAPRALY